MDNELREKRQKLICELMEDELYVPMKEKELAAFMQVDPADREEFSDILKGLLAENKLQRTSRGKYMKNDGHLLTGSYVSNSKGFGFVEIEGREQDLFIPEGREHGAFHLDTVQVELVPGHSGKRQEAEVVAVIRRGITHLVGTYRQKQGSGTQGFGFVIPDNRKLPSDIYIPAGEAAGAKDGQKVVVELTNYGDTVKGPEGTLTQILGNSGDPGVDILSIIKGYDLPMEFPDNVEKLAERVPEVVSESAAAGRLDLRGMTMVTIDGEDARDLDDAVSISMQGEDYLLGVHIADVSNYVTENSALDREALKRGTSVYLVDRVLPMLPPRLSNGICSLNQGEDRLALSCLMKIDPKGEVIDYEIAESVIRVDRRMTYTGVSKILEDQDPEEMEKYRELIPDFQRMAELAAILRKRRSKRGSIDFDFPESKIVLDGDGRPTDILPYDRNIATKMIEDFMLAANETVAQHFYWLELPFVYRTHDNPDPERMKKLELFINNFGYAIKASRDEVHPKEIQKLLARIDGTPEEALISRLALRSMKQAKYTMDCSGHFGLACPYYCHFTSPIRRYPDLQIHRIIKEQLHGRMQERRVEHYRAILPEVAKHSSEMERRADEVERETEKLKKAEYMENHIGEVYEGVISGVTNWGIYVELPNTVEGMIHVSALPGDLFYYEESACEMVGRDTGIRYKLGERLKIKVSGADRVNRTIDFTIPLESRNG